MLAVRNCGDVAPDRREISPSPHFMNRELANASDKNLAFALAHNQDVAANPPLSEGEIETLKAAYDFSTPCEVKRKTVPIFPAWMAHDRDRRDYEDYIPRKKVVTTTVHANVNSLSGRSTIDLLRVRSRHLSPKYQHHEATSPSLSSSSWSSSSSSPSSSPSHSPSPSPSRRRRVEISPRGLPGSTSRRPVAGPGPTPPPSSSSSGRTPIYPSSGSGPKTPLITGPNHSLRPSRTSISPARSSSRSRTRSTSKSPSRAPLRTSISPLRSSSRSSVRSISRSPTRAPAPPRTSISPARSSTSSSRSISRSPSRPPPPRTSISPLRSSSRSSSRSISRSPSRNPSKSPARYTSPPPKLVYTPPRNMSPASNASSGRSVSPPAAPSNVSSKKVTFAEPVKFGGLTYNRTPATSPKRRGSKPKSNRRDLNPTVEDYVERSNR